MQSINRGSCQIMQQVDRNAGDGKLITQAKPTVCFLKMWVPSWARSKER